MPRRSTVPSLDGVAATAHRAIQTEARLSVLRALLQRSPSTRMQLTEDTGLSINTVLTALRDLEEAGYVSGDVEGNRVGHRVTYAVDRGRLTADLFDFMGWLLG